MSQHAKRSTLASRHPAFVEPLEPRRLLTAVVDLRVAGGGKTAAVSSVGQVINLELWATITGKDANGANDGLQSATGSLLSTNIGGGAVRGNLVTALVAPFNANASVVGTQQDLDADGDLDVGSNIDTNAAGFFVARAGSMTFTGGVVSGASNSFKIGTATFTVTKLLGGTQTNLVFRPRNHVTAAVWNEDGTTASRFENGIFEGGDPLVVTVPPTGSISGRVFNDKNGDGLYDTGDVALAGYRVYLDKNNDGIMQKNEPSKFSGSTGTYTFSALGTGTYVVRQNPVDGFRFTTTNPQVVKLVNGDARKGQNFGQTTNVLIKGILWSDSNKDQIIQPAEARLSGWIVYVDANQDGVFDTGELTSTTDSSGTYRFVTLPAGTYQIRVIVQSGFKKTTSSDRTFTLTSGQSISNRNFGFKKIA